MDRTFSFLIHMIFKMLNKNISNIPIFLMWEQELILTASKYYPNGAIFISCRRSG